MLTAHEWLSENSERQELALQNIPLAMELYAKYREAELSRPPKDVVEAIEAQKEIYAPYSNVETWADKQEAFKDGGKYGYSLASGEFEQLDKWIYEKELVYQDGDWYWKEDTDGDQPMRLTTIYEIFKKERNG